MKDFEFQNWTKIVFGKGKIDIASAQLVGIGSVGICEHDPVVADLDLDDFLDAVPRIFDISALGGLAQLHTLLLHDNQLTGIPTLLAFTNLTEVTVDHNLLDQLRLVFRPKVPPMALDCILLVVVVAEGR